MKEKIIQFGTGNFLRGFADQFIDELNKKDLFDGSIVIVSPTDSKNTDKINAQHGKYHLILRGIDGGKEVYETKRIDSVSRAVNPYRDFSGFLALAKDPDLCYIISNTTESGIAFDDSCAFSDSPASSFPGKLTQFLFERYKNHLNGFIILACELIDDNGKKLEEYVLRYADKWRLGKDFSEWILRENRFCNTLVDRIVTGYPKEEAEGIFRELGCEDALLDTAEPYHLWVIEGDFENELPFKAAGLNVIWSKDVAPYKKMKVRVLNGAHTSLVFPSLLCGVETVGESLKDEQLRDFLNLCLDQCILPSLGNSKECIHFAGSVLERFANPFIKHMWRSISLNSVSKFRARVLPSITDYLKLNGSLPLPLVFSLACLILYYKNEDVCDDPAFVDYIRKNDLSDILENEKLWGRNLGFLFETVFMCLNDILDLGIRGAIKKVLR